jgi:hypothetical protein
MKWLGAGAIPAGKGVPSYGRPCDAARPRDEVELLDTSRRLVHASRV